MKVVPEILAALWPENLLAAYAQGIFPMVEGGRLMWFSPEPRGMLPLDERFHVSRSLAGTIRRGTFACTVDRCFAEVMDLCSVRPATGTWISAEMKIAYGRLHEMGFAHSVEAWAADSVARGAPAGGVYGVSIGGAFFAESMFHTRTDAGKVALAYLVERLRDRGFAMCDVQWTIASLRRFGAFDVPRNEYLAALARAVHMRCTFVESL